MKQTRLHELDWLRVIAILILLGCHTGMIFVSWSWHIKSAETSHVLETVMAWLHYWRMPLLLFISGAGACFALGFRRPLQFLAERHRRLLAPLVFGMLVIVPPQIYLERAGAWESYAAFDPTVFEFVPYWGEASAGMNRGVWLNFVLICAFSLAASMMIYHFAIRPFRSPPRGFFSV